MSVNDLAIRLASSDDLPFLRAMLYEAAYWRPDVARPPMEEGLAAAELAKLLAGWGRPGDAGVIAFGTEPLGAAWYRRWTEDDHSYGYVANDVPEVAIGVRADVRGRGIGRVLMRALIERAHADGFSALSLSVEVDNPARRLYSALGFQRVGTLGNAWTMLLRL